MTPSQIRVTAIGHDEQARQQVADGLRAALTGAGIEVKSAASISRGEAVVVAGHLGPVVLGIALPPGIVGLIGLASVMGANVLDRTREFGVLHAVGARPRAARRIIVTGTRPRHRRRRGAGVPHHGS